MSVASLSTDASDARALLHSCWMESQIIDGRSTACLVSLSSHRMSWCNVGDGGCWVLRRRRGSSLGVAFKTPPQLWDWNCPYQLGRLDDVELNTPADADAGEVALQAGDVVVLATDGLYDALHPLEILELVAHDLRADVSAQDIATTLVQTAIAMSKDSLRMSPVALAMQREGYVARSRELQDDVTAVVAKVLQ